MYILYMRFWVLQPTAIIIPMFVSKLIQEGLTQHEISERVKEKALNESESIYGTLYGTLDDQKDMYGTLE